MTPLNAPLGVLRGEGRNGAHHVAAPQHAQRRVQRRHCGGDGDREFRPALPHDRRRRRRLHQPSRARWHHHHAGSRSSRGAWTQISEPEISAALEREKPLHRVDDEPDPERARARVRLSPCAAFRWRCSSAATEGAVLAPWHSEASRIFLRTVLTSAAMLALIALARGTRPARARAAAQAEAVPRDDRAQLRRRDPDPPRNRHFLRQPRP